MGDVVNFPISLDSDLGRQLVIDCARFREGLLDEKSIRKKYRFDEAAWEALGNDEMVRMVEEDSVRRIRDGSAKREKSQLLVVKAPDVAASIMNSADSNDRHRLDACKILNDLSTNPSESTAAVSDRFVISINLSGDVLTFNRSIKSDPHDVDLGEIGTTPRPAIPVVIADKPWDGDGG